MRKILIELQIDWKGYEDVSDELIVEDAIEQKAEGVGWTLLRQPIVNVQSEQFICPCCGSDKTYKTYAIHCKRCAVTTEI